MNERESTALDRHYLYKCTTEDTIRETLVISDSSHLAHKNCQVDQIQCSDSWYVRLSVQDSWGVILSVYWTCHLELSLFLCQVCHVTLLFQVKTENPPLLPTDFSLSFLFPSNPWLLCLFFFGVLVDVWVCGMVICFVSALGSHEMGRHKLPIIIIIRIKQEDCYSLWDFSQVISALDFFFSPQIRNSLHARGYKVWMDIDNISGSTLQAMAEAVEDSSVVLLCMSQRYKDSPNCRTGM